MTSPERNAAFLKMSARRALGHALWRDEYAPMVASDAEVVREALAAHGRVYLSDERLWLDGAADPRVWLHVEHLAHELGAEDNTIVVYLRRQDLFVQSLWAEYVKLGDKTPFVDWLAQIRATGALDYLRCLTILAMVFGRESVVVRVYDRPSLVAGDVCHDFCEAVGVGWDEGFVPPRELNASLTNDFSAILSATNAAPSRDAVGRLFRTIAEEGPAAAGRDGSTMLGEADRAALLAEYAEGNARVVREFLGREDGILFPDSGPDESTWDPTVPQALRDVCFFFAEAVAREHARTEALEREVDALKAELQELRGRLRKRG